MNRRENSSIINNIKTINMYRRQCLSLAENVFIIKNLPLFIDKGYVNSLLLRQCSIAFFVDEIMGLLALPYTNLGILDVYGRPTKIVVTRSKWL